jgi:hypothetical protein
MGLPNRDQDASHEALEAARTMPSGQEKMEALKKAGCCEIRPMQAGFHSRSVAGHGSKAT